MHSALPSTGVMARIRAMAIADARKQAEAAAQAKQAELEEIAACSICSADIGAMMLTPRTAAALRHERERAWLQAWSDTNAVQNTSIWLGLPPGCAPDKAARILSMQQQQYEEQQLQQGAGPGFAARQSSAAAADMTVWMGMPPYGAVSPEMWQQQQRMWLQQAQLRGMLGPRAPSISGSSTLWSGLPSVPRFDPAWQPQQQSGLLSPGSRQQQQYRWEQQQQKLQQDAAKAWFLRAHPIPIQTGSDDEGSTAGSVVSTPLLRVRH
jgi:hypothetical protein